MAQKYVPFASRRLSAGLSSASAELPLTVTQLCLIAGSNSGNVFARRYSGFFDTVVPGEYRFSLTSDDGSFLWLDGASTPLLNDNNTPSGPDCGAIAGVIVQIAALASPPTVRWFGGFLRISVMTVVQINVKLTTQRRCRRPPGR